MQSALEIVDLETHGAAQMGSTLVRVHSKNLPVRIEEQAVVHRALSIGDIDFVYFRRFSDGRSSQPAAFVVDNSQLRMSESELARLHHRLWMDGSAPLLYVGWASRVDVLSCARGPDFWSGSDARYCPAAQIEVAANISRSLSAEARRFSARSLSDGTFWENPENESLAESGKTAHKQLIASVIETDRAIKGEENPLLRRLLLLTVWIRYLEARNVFPERWFSQFEKRATNFFELLQHGTASALRNMLSAMERKFNGDIFDLPEAKHLHLRDSDLRRFADLVEAKTIQQQRYLWEQYGFRYIPVEVLSHLYQHFAQKGRGAVFTPPLLAQLLLDYALPYAELTGRERVFDPTCGSGIFLVGAFRRLVEAWRSQHGWNQPNVDILKEIARNCIFGAEVQEEAAHLTAFSIALAICDTLQPNVIWNELRFDKLVGKNLHVGDVFDHIKELKRQSERFSAVIGNPPFMSKTDAGMKSEIDRIAIPDNQMAYAIADQCMGILSPKGRTCLIQPHGFLYNSQPERFRNSFIRHHRLDFLLDFTSVRSMFDGADPKTVAIVARPEGPQSGHKITHLTFRRTFAVQERIGFELDHYDVHVIPQGTAEAYPWVWRCNLLGGGRLLNLACRLRDMPTLRDYVERRGWDYGEGFIAAESGRREPAAWLTGKPLLPTEALTSRGIDDTQIEKVTATKFRSAYTPKRYTAPIILIRENEALPAAFRKSGFLAYKHKIVGIHSEKSDELELARFYTTFRKHHRQLRAFCLLLGTQVMTGKSTALLKRDLDTIPWPTQLEQGWDLTKWEKLLCTDLVLRMAPYIRRGQNSPLLQHGVGEKDLRAFARVFVSMLGTVYSDLHPGVSGTFDGLAFHAFTFGKHSELKWLSQAAGHLRDLVYRQHSETLRTVRVLRMYDRNTIILVKPNRLRYWIASVAIRDADETLVDLTKQGY